MWLNLASRYRILFIDFIVHKNTTSVNFISGKIPNKTFLLYCIYRKQKERKMNHREMCSFISVSKKDPTFRHDDILLPISIDACA